MSGLPPAGRPGSSRRVVIASVAVLVAVVAGVAWLSVEAYNLFHTEPFAVSKLRPVKITGPAQTVFDWSRDACEPLDVPDAPARAFRDSDGQVHLIASHYITRQDTGPSLDRVKHRCAVVMRSAYDPDPSAFQDREWLASPYTRDGRTVFALIHDEYQGNTHPGQCPSGVYLRCWYNAITLARSDDKGATFRHALAAPSHLVAELPFRYRPDQGPLGVFQPSNIVHRGGYYYSLVSTKTSAGRDYGACPMRTTDLADPTSWRAWDGAGYNARFVDPYRGQVATDNHTCSRVSFEQIADMTFSLTYNTYFRKYLLVSPADQYSGARRGAVSGFYYSLSDNLVDWSVRKLIREAVLITNYRCGGPDPVYYPSVLDPSSSSRNFETTGRRPYLYFTRLHYEGCRQTLHRDLERVPIEFSK